VIVTFRTDNLSFSCFAFIPVLLFQRGWPVVTQAGAIIIHLCNLTMAAYLGRMFKSLEFCLPTRSTIVPHTADWLHEIKYDGYRIRLTR
jgi:hypothetical protein